MTFAELVERYLKSHAVGREASALATLGERLAYSLSAFGDLKLCDLERRTVEIAEWHTTLPERSRYGIVQAFRQSLEAGVRWGLMTRNPAKLAGSNPQSKRPEIEPFTRAEIDRLALELGAWGSIPIFAGETGPRPSEWIAVQWRDVSRGDGVVLVQRTFSRGRLRLMARPSGHADAFRCRHARSTRSMQIPRRINSALVFPAPGGGNRVRAGHGGYVDLHNWRAREWLPALDAAGLPRRRIYDLRHSFATWALAAGLSIFELARYMGTSVDMIDRTYGHLARGSEDLARAKLDAHAATDVDRLGQDWATP